MSNLKSKAIELISDTPDDVVVEVIDFIEYLKIKKEKKVKKSNKFNAISIKTNGYKFDREAANERKGIY